MRSIFNSFLPIPPMSDAQCAVVWDPILQIRGSAATRNKKKEKENFRGSRRASLSTSLPPP